MPTSSDFIQAIGWTVIHSLWQFSGIGLIVIGLLLCGKNRWRSQFRYGVCGVGLLAMCAVSGGTILWELNASSARRIADSHATMTCTVESASSELKLDSTPPERAVEQPPAIAVASHPIVDGLEVSARVNLVPPETSPTRITDGAITQPAIGESSVTHRGDPEQSTNSFAQHVQPASEPNQFASVATVTWFIGVSLVTVWHLGGYLLIFRLRYIAISSPAADVRAAFDRTVERLLASRSVTLLESAIVRAPVVIGWLRPVVLVPAGMSIGLSAEQLESVLAHELAHIKRRDGLVNILQAVAETLFFYHPAVWWLSRRIRVEREHCCDDTALSIHGDGVAFAEALLLLTERSSRSKFALAATGTPSEGETMTRIKRLLGETQPLRIRSLRMTVCFLLLVSAGFVLSTVADAQLPQAESRTQDDAAASDSSQPEPAPGDAAATESRPDKAAEIQGINSLAFTADGSRLITANENGLIHIINPKSGDVERIVRLPKASDVSSNGQTIVASQDGRIRLWKVTDESNPSGRVLLSSGGDKAVRIWDVRASENPLAKNLDFNKLELSPDGKLLAGLTSKQIIHIVDSRSGRVKYRMRPHQGEKVTVLAFTPDGMALVTGTRGGTVQLWNLKNGKQVFISRYHTSAVTGFAVVKDKLLSVSRDKKLNVLRLSDGSLSSSVSEAQPIQGVKLSKGANVLAVWLEDGTVKFRKADSLKVSSAGNHSEKIRSLAFTPDGKLLASGGTDGAVRIWDVATGKPVRLLMGKPKQTAQSPIRRIVYHAKNDSLPIAAGFNLFNDRRDQHSTLEKIDSQPVLRIGRTTQPGRHYWHVDRFPLNFDGSGRGTTIEWVSKTISSRSIGAPGWQRSGFAVHLADHKKRGFYIYIGDERIHLLNKGDDSQAAVASINTADRFHHFRFVVDDEYGRLFIDGSDQPVLSRKVGEVDSSDVPTNSVSFGDLTELVGGEALVKSFAITNQFTSRMIPHPTIRLTSSSAPKRYIEFYGEDGISPFQCGFQLLNSDRSSAAPRLVGDALKLGPTSKQGLQYWHNRDLPIDFSANNVSLDWTMQVNAANIANAKNVKDAGFIVQLFDRRNRTFRIVVGANRIWLQNTKDEANPQFHVHDSTAKPVQFRFSVVEDEGRLYINDSPIPALTKSVGDSESGESRANEIAFGDLSEHASSHVLVSSFEAKVSQQKTTSKRAEVLQPQNLTCDTLVLRTATAEGKRLYWLQIQRDGSFHFRVQPDSKVRHGKLNRIDLRQLGGLMATIPPSSMAHEIVPVDPRANRYEMVLQKGEGHQLYSDTALRNKQYVNLVRFFERLNAQESLYDQLMSDENEKLKEGLAQLQKHVKTVVDSRVESSTPLDFGRYRQRLVQLQEHDSGDVRKLAATANQLIQGLSQRMPKDSSTPSSTEGAELPNREIEMIRKLGGKVIIKDGKVHEINLTNSAINDTDMELLSSMTTLQTLTLNGCRNMTDAGLVYLGSLKNLRGLALERTNITDKGMVHLKDLTEIGLLSLNWTRVGDAGLKQLSGLKKMGILYLCQTQTGDEGVAAMKNMKQLVWLDLRQTRVTDAGLVHLSQLPRMRLLCLYGIQMTDAGIAPLTKLANLESLTLNQTQVTDEGAQKLITLPKLIDLDLLGSRVTPAGRKKLETALPKCDID